MKTKIAYFSFFCGAILFILIFVCQFFFKIYSNGSNLNKQYVLDAIFLTTYSVAFCLCLLKWKNINKIILYIVIPFGIGCSIRIFSSIYYYTFYGSYIFFCYLDILYFYFALGFWSVGVFGGGIDLIISNCLQNEKSTTVNKNAG